MYRLGFTVVLLCGGATLGITAACHSPDPASDWIANADSIRGGQPQVYCAKKDDNTISGTGCQASCVSYGEGGLYKTCRTSNENERCYTHSSFIGLGCGTTSIGCGGGMNVYSDANCTNYVFFSEEACSAVYTKATQYSGIPGVSCEGI